MSMLQGLIGGTPSGAAPDDIVKDGDTRSFAEDVIRASQTSLVIVDFWATWCGPCKQLTPLLEKVVRATGGKARLVKIDIDKNPQLAQQLRIQSVPTVYAFAGGQPVDGFMGALPESQIRAFVERLIGPAAPDEAELGIDDAKAALDSGDVQTAGAIYDQLLQKNPEDPAALGGFARCLTALGQLDDARATLDAAPKALAAHAEIEGARAALGLALEAGDLPPPEALAARLEASPDDHEARVRLATALFLRGRVEEAMDHLLLIVRRDREWNDDGGRKALIRLFDALGPVHPETVRGRKRLSSVLFS